MKRPTRRATRPKKINKILLCSLLLNVAFIGSGTYYELRHPYPAGTKQAETIITRYSPKGGCEALIIIEIAKAEARIDVAIYSFSSKPIAAALLAAHARGVVVRIVADKDQAKPHYSMLKHLDEAGIQVCIKTSNTMHLKEMAIDGKVLLTGSYNYSQRAESNNTEVLRYMKAPDLAEIAHGKISDLVGMSKSYAEWRSKRSRERQ
jgi:phosphatidylserine/phosphatidylglycerophosphate/cardiolipin synthase-like enzyme